MKKEITIRLVEWLTVGLCRNNPNSLFLFGDNCIQKGKAGQANIRDESNSFGIPTKRFPTMNYDAFMRDSRSDYGCVNNRLKELKALLNSNKYNTIVFPKSGLGTGLAKMPETSPKLFKELSKKFEKRFNLRLNEDGFIFI